MRRKPGGGFDIRLGGEAGSGDGLRREWFKATAAKIMDPAHGLFVSQDDCRTLQPNPHSALAVGADHLSYFALLGRIAGLALYHREPLNAPLTVAFVKAVMGYPITPEDLESMDPDAVGKRIEYVRDCTTDEGLVAVDLTFEDDGSDAAIVYTRKEQQRVSVELKEGGAGIAVIMANKNEYLQLLAEHRLVGAIRPQIAAFRDGLSLFVDDELRATVRQCCSEVDVQLLLGGLGGGDQRQ